MRAGTLFSFAGNNRGLSFRAEWPPSASLVKSLRRSQKMLVYICSRLTNALKGHIALFAAQVIYALNYSVAKGLMPTYIHPLALVLARVLGAAILFWILSLFVKTQTVQKGD